MFMPSQEYKLGLTTWSLLFGGILAGRYNNGIPERSRFDRVPFLKNLAGDLDARVKTVQQLQVVAQELGATMAQFSISWCAANKNVSIVMLGASSVGQMEENLKAIPFVDMITPEILARVDQIVQYKPDLDSDQGLELVKMLRPTFT